MRRPAPGLENDGLEGRLRRKALPSKHSLATGSGKRRYVDARRRGFGFRYRTRTVARGVREVYREHARRATALPDVTLEATADGDARPH